MAKGMKSGGRDFIPGESGNPNGRPKIPVEIKQAREVNRAVFERLLNEYLFLSLQSIEARLKDPSTPAVELLVGKAITEGIKRGDPARTSYLLERLIGKPPRKEDIKEGNLHAQIMDAISRKRSLLP